MHAHYRFGHLTRLGAALPVIALVLTGCAGASSGTQQLATPTVASAGVATATSGPAAQAGKAVSVLYAGSLVNLMEKGIGPAFHKDTGIAYQGQGAGSVALANAIKDKTKTGDVFISADPTVNTSLIGPSNGNWVSWYLLFARTSMVIGFNPNSKFAADFGKARDGAMPWYEVLREPGLKLGRTDPNLDPKGYRTLFLFDLAQDFYKEPNLREQILGPDGNTEQIFPEETLETRLETGALDAGVFYLNEAAERNLPYVTLPDEINQSNPDMAAAYAKATYTNAKGQAFTGGPVIYTAAVLNQAKDSAAATSFVQYLLASSGQGIMKEHGLLSSAVLFGGDRAAVPAPLQPLVQSAYKN